MFEGFRNHAIAVVIAATFFIAGFLPVANLLSLSSSEIILGLAAGIAGGLWVLISVLWNETRRVAAPPVP